jgi:hypothetical protein
VKYPDLRNCLVTTPKVYTKIADGTINSDTTFNFNGLEVIADIWCPEDRGYFFDENGELVSTIIFEGLE